MRTETWEQLNGMCFGDGPFEDHSGVDPYGEDYLLVPECVQYQPKPQFYAYDIPVAVYCGQAAGRVKRRQHLTERNHRRSKNATFWIAVGFGLLVLAVNLPEWIF